MRSGNNLPKEVAEAFGVTPDLLPFLPELLADLWALGSWPERIVEVLRESAVLPPAARVVELGCGKGAVAIALARELGCRVRGIDLFPPFVEEATARAEAAGVAERCRFEVGDLRDAVQELEGRDAVVTAAVGADLFGDHTRCVGELRRVVRRGGYLALNDGFLRRAERLDWPGYGYYRGHAATIRELTAHGDSLVREMLVPAAELVAFNRRSTELIRRRAERLARLHPEHAESLARYLRSEEAECALLERETREAVWLLQRRDR